MPIVVKINLNVKVNDIGRGICEGLPGQGTKCPTIVDLFEIDTDCDDTDTVIEAIHNYILSKWDTKNKNASNGTTYTGDLKDKPLGVDWSSSEYGGGDACDTPSETIAALLDTCLTNNRSFWGKNNFIKKFHEEIKKDINSNNNSGGKTTNKKYKKTNRKVKVGNVERCVYVGVRGGEYIKANGEMCPLRGFGSLSPARRSSPARQKSSKGKK